MYVLYILRYFALHCFVFFFTWWGSTTTLRLARWKLGDVDDLADQGVLVLLSLLVGGL